MRLVHPHACGDYMGRHVERFGLYGPSPRVWGLRTRAAILAAGYRSIPTRVGTTRRQGRCRMPRRSIPTRVGTTALAQSIASALEVHPHACGDYARLGEVRRAA